MNNAAKLVSDSLTGKSDKTVTLAGKEYKIYPPTLKIICKGISQWASIDFDEERQNTFSVIAQIPTNYAPMLRGISSFIVGDVQFACFKSAKLYSKLRSATTKEVSLAMAIIIEQIGAQDFFDCAVLLKSVVKMAASPKS